MTPLSENPTRLSRVFPLGEHLRVTSHRLRPGALIVFEGLDSAGKTTQLDLLRARTDAGRVLFAHMPTGFRTFTRVVRDLLEDPAVRPESGLAQQLAHLASHAESVPALRRSLETHAVVLDRWWWSTVAYGWHGGAVEATGLKYHEFRALINAVWAGVIADVVFVFEHPHRDDANNNEGVADGYRQLRASAGPGAVLLPRGDRAAVAAIVDAELDRRGLLDVE